MMCGEQPRESREKRARQNRSQGKGENGSKGQWGEEKKATHCISSSTSQPQPQAQHPQQQQQQRQLQSEQRGFSDDRFTCRPPWEKRQLPWDQGYMLSCYTVRTDVAKNATKLSAVKCPLRCESLGSRLRLQHWLETCWCVERTATPRDARVKRSSFGFVDGLDDAGCG